MKSLRPLVQPGRITRHYNEGETASLLAAWLEAFGKERQGSNTKAFLWHIFSANKYPNVAGAEALVQYKQQEESQFVVLSNDRKVAFATDVRPDECALSDFYVFPENLAWTMAFTHEDGWLGPYFARHQEFARLNVANLAKLKKLREMEAAKQKGWL
jgi:Domain of unknown function (DUF4275)